MSEAAEERRRAEGPEAAGDSGSGKASPAKARRREEEDEAVDLSRRRLLKMEGAREAVREMPGKVRAAAQEKADEAAQAIRAGAEKAADYAGERLGRLAPEPGSAERAGRAAGKAVREAGEWAAEKSSRAFEKLEASEKPSARKAGIAGRVIGAHLRGFLGGKR